MGKDYHGIKTFLGEQNLVFDEDNGVYLVESMNELLEERCTTAMQKEKTLSAKLEEIELMKEEKKNIETMLEETKKALENANEKLNNANSDSEKLTQEKTELEKKILEATKEQEQAMEQINNLQETIKEKDKEIEELSSKVSAQPVSTTSDEEDSKKQETKGPRNVTEKGMSLKEKAEALEKRRMELLGVR